VKPWVSGRFGGVSSGNPNITGTASNVGTGSGVQSFTVTRQQTGTYNVSWTTAHPSGSSYTILVAVRGAFTCSYGIPASTSFQIYTYNVGTTTLADPTAGDISFMVLQ
jgi:hypothetical protein